jgi:hypothetical protein
MKILIPLLLGLLVVPMSGCIFIRTRSPGVNRPRCDRNEYWDGERCRNKRHRASPGGHGHGHDHDDD